MAETSGWALAHAHAEYPAEMWATYAQGDQRSQVSYPPSGQVRLKQVWPSSRPRSSSLPGVAPLPNRLVAPAGARHARPDAPGANPDIDHRQRRPGRMVYEHNMPKFAITGARVCAGNVRPPGRFGPRVCRSAKATTSMDGRARAVRALFDRVPNEHDFIAHLNHLPSRTAESRPGIRH
jgi:hypothetical protein